MRCPVTLQYSDSMTDETQVPELEIDFQGRMMWVRMPSPEQLLVWKRTLRKLQEADVQGWNGEQAMTALERTRKIIDSILVNRADIEWLDDEMLAGNVTLLETATLLQTTVDSFVDAAEAEGNRETRRAAPTKKAARKKAAPAAGKA
jgi:hypothetical protein